MTHALPISNRISTTTPGATVLEETPGRALDFLRGVTRSRVLYAQLAHAGYTQEEHQEGWRLLFKAAGYAPDAPVAPPPRADADAAIVELDAWDEAGFARVRAALDRLHPEQSELVFAGGLAASAGAAAVVGVKTLLDRLDALEHGKDRPKAARKADLAALATLDRRGITAAERARLRALVERAAVIGDAPGDGEKTRLAERAARTRTEDLARLYAWYKDWSVTARSVIKKRASLITLGLAKRKSRAKAPPPAGATTSLDGAPASGAAPRIASVHLATPRGAR